MTTKKIDLTDLDTSELDAFAPTGDPIKCTVEAGVTWMPILHHYLAGERFCHEFSDSGADRPDTETVSVDGEPLYLCTNYKIWPESALTYKTLDGDLVREGVQMAPIELLDPAKMYDKMLSKKQPDAMTVLAELGACSWLDADPCDIEDLAKAKARARALLGIKG